MRIGIITYHNTRNCGAVLQSYALMETIKKIGFSAKIIDYKCEEIDKAYIIKKPWELRGVKEAVKWLLTVGINTKAQKKFDLFKKEKLVLTGAYDKNNITKINSQFDGFITGSDQVWNFNLNGADENYILKFAAADKKKISYAASLGYKEIPEDYISLYKENLATFSGISVRETDGKTALECLGFSCETVVDPTLLLDKGDYFELEADNKWGKYIFVYTVAVTPNIEKKAKELSKKTGLPIIWGHMSYKNYKGVKNIKSPFCDEFLSLIKNAEYVVTSSFHGMAFSIIYEKEFFFDLSVSKNNYNSRLTSLADTLELSNREIRVDRDMLNYEKIDYNRVNRLKEKKKEEAIKFLKDSFGI